MVEKNISQEFRLKNIDGTINYFAEKIEQNESMSKKHKEVCITLNYIKHFLVLVSKSEDVFQFLFFLSLVGVSIGITSSAIGLKNCAIIAGIKRYTLIINKKRSMIK